MIKILAMTSSNMQPYLFTTFYPMHLRKLHMQNKILLEMNEHIIFFFQLHSVVFPFMACKNTAGEKNNQRACRA